MKIFSKVIESPSIEIELASITLLISKMPKSQFKKLLLLRSNYLLIKIDERIEELNAKMDVWIKRQKLPLANDDFRKLQKEIQESMKNYEKFASAIFGDTDDDTDDDTDGDTDTKAKAKLKK